jgi:hypothetical protein
MHYLTCICVCVCSPLLSTVFFVLLNFFEKAVLIGINYVGQQGELSGCEYKYKHNVCQRRKEREREK